MKLYYENSQVKVFTKKVTVDGSEYYLTENDVPVEFEERYKNSRKEELEGEPVFKYEDVSLSLEQKERFNFITKISGLSLKEIEEYVINDVEPDNPAYKVVLLQKVAHKVKTAEELYNELKKEDVTLEELKLAKIEVLKEKCTLAVNNGFTSLTTQKVYGFNSHDQENFTQKHSIILRNMVLGKDVKGEVIKWKTKDEGIVDHTVDQFFAICDEAEIHKMTQQGKYWQLEAKVLAAKQKEEVAAINW